MQDGCDAGAGGGGGGCMSTGESSTTWLLLAAAADGTSGTGRALSVCQLVSARRPNTTSPTLSSCRTLTALSLSV